MNHITHISTFYSFKGGVGRTLLLANVGAYLARHGRRVLLWDLDVEAPGMHLIPALASAPPPEEGFLEWLLAWQKESSSGDAPPRLLKRLYEKVYQVPKISNLYLLPAFGDKADAAGLYQDIRWNEFLVRKPEIGLELLRTLLNFLSETGRFEHILLDARTGITDLGGFMTAVLPHATVLVGSYGSQNLSGLLRIYKALQPAVEGRIPARKDTGDLRRLVVVSPVPQDRVKRLESRRSVWDEEFPAGKEHTRIEIPFDSRLLFTEDLLTQTDPDSPASQKYAQVAWRIDEYRDALAAANANVLKKDAAYPENRSHLELKMAWKIGLSFEERVARLLSLLEYKLERKTGDEKRFPDLVAKKRGGLREECYWVLCRDETEAVSSQTVEGFEKELRKASERSGRIEGMIVGRSFSLAAEDAAKSAGILLYTPEDLENLLFDFAPYLNRLMSEFEESDLARTYVSQRVLLEKNPDSCEGVELLPHALSWAAGQGPSLWLLLGDYGTGKSSFFKRFAYELAVQRRSAEPGAPSPAPIAIDLKEFPNAITLEGLLQEHLRVHADWHGNPDMILYLLEAGRAVLLLDAFDEMGTAAAGRSVEEQFRMLASPGTGASSKAGNRILITCRTHFFRDQQYVKDVCGALKPEAYPRDSALGKVARAFNASIDELMLFDDKQIRAFLNNHLPSRKAKQAEAFIRNTYDLPSLAPRPVLLEMIVKALPEMMRAGERMTPSRLYAHYTDQWLTDRSGGSLQTTAEQRKRLLELLAAELWTRAQNRIHHRQLLDVFELIPKEQTAGLDLDRVDLELRTAAFLVRDARGYYRFSHKSFLEFFFARHIVGLLLESNDRFFAGLAAGPMTPECRDFLLDMIPLSEMGEMLFPVLRLVLVSPYREGTSENALRIAWSAAVKLAARTAESSVGAGETAAEMQKIVRGPIVMKGADLRGEKLAGAWLAGAYLDGAQLSGTTLNGAVISGASLFRADLTGCQLNDAKACSADFREADLTYAQARQGDFSGAFFTDAKLSGAVMVGTCCENADFTRCDCTETRFAKARLKNALWEQANIDRMTCPDAEGCPQKKGFPLVPLPFVSLGHYAGLTSSVFSQDGRMILTASEDHTARLWETTTGKEIRRFQGHDAPVASAVFSSDGKRVLTASYDHTARLWDIAIGKEIRRFQGHDRRVASTVFSSDDKRILTASGDKTARLWDTATGKEIRRFQGHEARVNFAVFSPDGKRILTASGDKTARLWDSATGKEIGRFKGHEDRVNFAVFSPDGKRILTASGDKSARLWDTATGKEIRRFQGHKDRVNFAVFSPGGKRILTASGDSTARLWDSGTGKEIRRFQGHDGWVTSAVFSPDGKRILTASNDKTPRLWDSAIGREIRRFSKRDTMVITGVFSPDGKQILTTSGDKIARLWEFATGKEIRRFMGHDGSINSAVFSPDQKRILTASEDKTVRLWDTASGKEIRCLLGHIFPVISAAFSPGGKRILSASNNFLNFQHNIRLWDTDTGKEIRRFKENGGFVYSALFSPDGKRILAVSGDGSARLREVATGKEIRRFQGHNISTIKSALFSSDGQHILTASGDGTAHLWDACTGKEIRRFQGHGYPVLSAVFSPDGKLVLTASVDHTARLWDTATGKEIRRFEGHDYRVYSAVFSPDQKHILTASGDNTARAWEVETGAVIGIFVHLTSGWLFLDRDGKFRAGGNGLDFLSYRDETERALFPTFWHPEDLPDTALPD